MLGTACWGLRVGGLRVSDCVLVTACYLALRAVGDCVLGTACYLALRAVDDYVF